MRLRAACLAVVLTFPICTPTLACSLEAMRKLLLSSDDHVTWADFWSDLDEREALSELGYAQSDLRHLGRLIADPDCDDSRDVRAMRRDFASASAACTRRQALASRRP
jgi:hypothetical protein